MKVSIKWVRTADELPDDEELVLTSDDAGEVFVGWIDGGQWRDVLATPIDPPTHWAHMPESTK